MQLQISITLCFDNDVMMVVMLSFNNYSITCTNTIINHLSNAVYRLLLPHFKVSFHFKVHTYCINSLYETFLMDVIVFSSSCCLLVVRGYSGRIVFFFFFFTMNLMLAFFSSLLIWPIDFGI